MTLKQRIWMLPLLAALIFALGVPTVLILSTRTSATIGSLRAAEYPHLQGMTQFAWKLEGFIGLVQSAVAEGEKDRLLEANGRVVELRQLLSEMRQVSGKEEMVANLSVQFEAYAQVTLEAAGILLGTQSGDRGQAVLRMQQTYKALDATVNQARASATTAVHKNISDASHGVQQMLWAIVACAVAVVGAVGLGSAVLQDAIKTAEQASRTKIEFEQNMVAAEQASRTKSEFLALMSHELRTPMSGVIGMLGLALKEDLRESVREKVSLALQNARNLLNILNDLLDIAKIESGKLNLESIDFQLEGIVQETLMLLEEHAGQKKTRLEATFDPRIPRYLRGDPTRVRQILINLVGNAIKFTDHGTVSIVLRLVESLPDNPEASNNLLRLHCAVTDTGVGMSEEVRTRLFQRFEQADTSTTRKHGGTGLGLSICKQLVELMGGWIDVRTTPGQGSTFYFELNLLPGRETTQDTPAEIVAHKRSLHVLVAEDGLTNQIVIESILQDMGHQVTIVENGELAVEAVQRQAFDVVLMDGRMPVMSGQESTRSIRQGHWRGSPIPNPGIPVIGLTANASPSDREEFLSAGADGFLTKPIDEVQLHKALGEVIEKIESGNSRGTRLSGP
jgi:signal transduction histidine kinase/ActR/RegA family two-component response regulator